MINYYDYQIIKPKKCNILILGNNIVNYRKLKVNKRINHEKNIRIIPRELNH